MTTTTATAPPQNDPYATQQLSTVDSKEVFVPWDDRNRLLLDALNKQLNVSERDVQDFQSRWGEVKYRPVSTKHKDMRDDLIKASGKLKEHSCNLRGIVKDADEKFETTQGKCSLEEQWKSAVKCSHSIANLLKKELGRLATYEFVLRTQEAP